MLKKCPEYVSFDIAQKFAQASGIQSEAEWREVDDLGWLPQEIPSHPEIYYANTYIVYCIIYIYIYIPYLSFHVPSVA